jgi:hypothetical protein
MASAKKMVVYQYLICIQVIKNLFGCKFLNMIPGWINSPPIGHRRFDIVTIDGHPKESLDVSGSSKIHLHINIKTFAPDGIVEKVLAT